MMYAYIYEFVNQIDEADQFRKAYLTNAPEELPKVGHLIKLESQDEELPIRCCRGTVTKVVVDFCDANDNVVVELKSTIKRHTIKLIEFDYVTC